MRHRVAGRKLGRTTEHRIALLRNLSTELFHREKIRTTLAKAKELRPFAEKLVTISKKETLHARRQVLRHIHDVNVVAKLFDTLSARYAQRPGGYTRIIKLGTRRGDNAEMAIIELVDSEATSAPAPKAAKGKGAKSKPATKGKSDPPDSGSDESEAPAKAKKKVAKKKVAKKKPATKKKASASKAKKDK